MLLQSFSHLQMGGSGVKAAIITTAFVWNYEVMSWLLSKSSLRHSRFSCKSPYTVLLRLQVPVLTRTEFLYFLICFLIQSTLLWAKYTVIFKKHPERFLACLSLADKCVGSNSIHIGSRNKKQRELLCESVCALFCASEELSCCQHWEVAAEIVVTDITCCSYSFDLERLDGAGVGWQCCCCWLLSWETVCHPLISLVITTCGSENPAPCQPCGTIVCTAQTVLFMAQLKYFADKMPSNGGTL